MVLLTVKSRSKSLKDCQVEVPKSSINDDELFASVQEQISKQNKNISRHRLRVTYKKDGKNIPIIDGKFFRDLTDDNLVLNVKDLGPQVSWRLVFFIEYIGPILVHSLFYYLSTLESVREKFHSGKTEYNPTLNTIAFILVVGHYLKRELETLFVHQFSLATMPLFNIFKNSFHYWVLSGAISFGYFGYGFIWSTSQLSWVYNALNQVKLSTLISLFVLSETWNFYIHLRLRVWGDQQKAQGNSKKRVPINDGIFKLLVAPNYSFEVWSWIWFTVIFKFNAFALLFLAISAGQMYLWAQKKNKKYGTKRAFLIPYIF